MDPSPRFLVVVPSIRQTRTGFEQVQARVKATFDLPTEYHLLDGSQGKPAALNLALQQLLPASQAEFYVTMDDDYIPPVDWQERAIQAMADFPKLGALSFWVGDDPALQSLIGAHRVGPPQAAGQSVVRFCERGHHLAGAILVYRRTVAEAVGPQPITAEKYQVWEDAWRGRKVQALRYELGFVEAEVPEFIEFDDPEEYKQWRTEQVIRSRKDQDAQLARTGIPDPWTLRLRRWVARVRGRSVGP